MTKNQFRNLFEGDKVTRSFMDIDRTKTPPEMYKRTVIGSVQRFNFGCSQVLIKWDSGSDQWHGRTSIEICDESKTTL